MSHFQRPSEINLQGYSLACKGTTTHPLVPITEHRKKCRKCHRFKNWFLQLTICRYNKRKPAETGSAEQSPISSLHAVSTFDQCYLHFNWFLVEQRIKFKIVFLKFKSINLMSMLSMTKLRKDHFNHHENTFSKFQDQAQIQQSVLSVLRLLQSRMVFLTLFTSFNILVSTRTFKSVNIAGPSSAVAVD